MKNLKKENGVTLVALVVTIIVLLILAVVSFSIIMGDNGILTKAVDAGSETKKAAAREALQMKIGELVADYYHDRYMEGNTVNTWEDAQAYIFDTTKGITSSTKLDGVTEITVDTSGKTIKLRYDTAGSTTATIGPKGNITDWTDGS